jgi:MFS family permease
MALLGLVLVAVGQSVFRGNDLSLGANVLDYRVVACGVKAAWSGADPYLTEPLRTCEHAVSPEPGEPSWAATPFALPPYSAAILAPFGGFEFAKGRALWYALIVLATCLTVAATAQIIGRPAFGVALLMAPTVGILNLRFGETVPFAIAAIAIAGLALEKRRPVVAAIFTALALLEPAIGLPAALGLFLLAPRARIVLAASVAVLAAIGIFAFGLARNLEYAFAFLPAHEHAELLASDQYSFTHLAYEFGASARVASLVGSLSYAIAVVVGLFLARRARERNASLIVLVPVAASMFGGPFVHDVEIAAALPAAIVLARDSRVAQIGVILLSVSWTQYWRFNLIRIAATAIGAALLFVRSIPRQVAYATAAFVLTTIANVATPLQSVEPESIATAPVHIAPTDLSSVPWEKRIESTASRRFDRTDPLVKLPTWIGLLLLPFGARSSRSAATSGSTRTEE